MTQSSKTLTTKAMTSSGYHRGPRACSSVDRASASGSGALASPPRFPGTFDRYAEIYGIRALDSCRARQLLRDLRWLPATEDLASGVGNLGVQQGLAVDAPASVGSL